MARLRAILVLAALPALAAPAVSAGAEPASFARLKTTHRISVSVELVNRWSFSTRQTCGFSGSGTLTVKANMARSRAVTPQINRSAGRWTILIPYFRNARDLPPQRATGTITRQDDTVQNPPPDPADPCLEKKTGCGTVPARDMQISVSGVNRRSIEVDLTSRDFQRHNGTCMAGSVDRWNNRVFFGAGAKQHLRLRMPSPRALRRRVVRVTDTARKTGRGGEDEIFADDVTRKATVTFRRR